MFFIKQYQKWNFVGWPATFLFLMENIFDIFILKYLIIICRIEISIYFIFYFTSLFAASSAPWLTYLLLDNMENFTTRIPVGFTMPLKISLGLNDPRSLLVNTSLAFEKNANIRVNSGLWLKLKHKKDITLLGLNNLSWIDPKTIFWYWLLYPVSSRMVKTQLSQFERDL